MADYKYVIVGAGLSGLTLAERIANELDEEVLIIEKRDHIGGNVYDFYDDGLLIQKYGPHIYHTNEKKVHDYLSQFTEWNDYVHRVLSYVDGKLVPMPICIDTLNKLYDLDLDEESMKEWIDEHKEDIDEVKSSEDVVLKNAGRDIYNKLFKNYTEKQWGTSAANLSSSVIYKDYLDRIDYETLIYTGPIDYFYDYKYGELLYRCLNFVYEIVDEDSYQDVAVVNYPNDPYFTRITEFKKLTWQEVEGKTAIMREYPGFNGEKCYPYPTQEYLDKFKLYEAEMEKEENVIFAGRLAKYKYYNMDLVVKDALEIFETQIK